MTLLLDKVTTQSKSLEQRPENQLQQPRQLCKAKKILQICALAVLSINLTACAQLSPIVPLPESVTLPDTMLQEKIRAQFPMQKQWLNLYQVKAFDPVLILDASKNRVRLQFEAILDGPMISAQNGLVEVSSSLKIDPTGQKLLLDNPAVERLYFKSLPGFIANNIETPIKIAIQNELNQKLIYQLKPEDAKIMGIPIQAKKIEVKPNHLILFIEKQKK
jgi:hypothetical protein